MRLAAAVAVIAARRAANTARLAATQKQSCCGRVGLDRVRTNSDEYGRTPKREDEKRRMADAAGDLARSREI